MRRERISNADNEDDGDGFSSTPPPGGNQRMANHGLTPPPSSFVYGPQEAMDNYYPYTNCNED